jgi:predicted ATPase
VTSETWYYTPALANDGADLAAAIATIHAIGDGAAFGNAIEDAFPGWTVGSGEDGNIAMQQRGLLRSLHSDEDHYFRWVWPSR